MILYIRNVGNVNVTLDSYYVEEEGETKVGHVTTIAGTIIPVNSVQSVTIAPEGFTWVSGHSYTIKLITSRGNQFTFSVIK